VPNPPWPEPSRVRVTRPKGPAFSDFSGRGTRAMFGLKRRELILVFALATRRLKFQKLLNGTVALALLA
jgi:hypothetical protein